MTGYNRSADLLFGLGLMPRGLPRVVDLYSAAYGGMNSFCCKEDDCNDNDYFCSDEMLNEESIIAFKIYGSCIKKECLGASKIGPAKAVEKTYVGCKNFKKGSSISPPEEAADINIDSLKIKKIIITRKSPNKFRKGFWDIYIKYIFEFRLAFCDEEGNIVGSVKAESTANQKVRLYGASCPQHSIGTDLLIQNRRNSDTFKTAPFVMVKAKAILLEPKVHLKKQFSNDPEGSDQKPENVKVAIGLCAEISLFHIVNLLVNSNGFCASEECEEFCNDSCGLFKEHRFPMDFA